jgi:transposase
MTEKRDIIRRLQKEQSIRAISKETGTHRGIIRDLKAVAEEEGWLRPEVPLPSEGEIKEALRAEHTTATGKEHPLNEWKDDIKRWLEEEHSYVVIHQLILEHYSCSESTVRRYCQRTFPQIRKAVMLRETISGEIMEVDFGYLGITYDPTERRNRKTYVFSARLRHSKHAYRERVYDQKQQTFFACHIHAFEHFGGVPEKVVPDNLKAAVLIASFEDPLINRMYQNLAIHYGFLISPTLPRKPEHKGGVENDIKYVKKNFWPIFKEHQRQKGNEVPDGNDLAQELSAWSKDVADARIIKGFGRSPREIFDEEEQAALQLLPLHRWDPMEGGTAKVQENWRIQFDCSFYSVPYQYIGEQVAILANSSTVYIFHDYNEIALHQRAPGKWKYIRKEEHAPPEKENTLRETKESLLAWAKTIGPSVELVAKAIFNRKGVDGLQPARSLLGLYKKYGPNRLNSACKRAFLYDTPEYRTVKTILKKGLDSCDSELPMDCHGQHQFRFVRETGFFDPDRFLRKGEQTWMN